MKMASSNKLILLVFFTQVITINSRHCHDGNLMVSKPDFPASLEKELDAKEEKWENSKRINRGFDRMMQMVNIFGQIDSFLTEKARKLVKTLSVLVNDHEKSTSFDE